MPVTPGVTATILSTTPDSGGYTVSIRLTNGDSAAIAYNPICPGMIEAFRAGEWETVTLPVPCASIAQALDPTKSATVQLTRQLVASSEQIRFVGEWSFLDGPFGQNQMISAPVAAQ
ncbi:MAG TPA: hypothetical protein VGM20_11965 [Gemmatimonadales bacterium]